MQVARYWRMKKHNYRLEGVRYNNGVVSVQPRLTRPEEQPALPAERQREAVNA